MKNIIRCTLAIVVSAGILLPSTVFAQNVFVTPSGTTNVFVGDDVAYHAECLFCFGPHELTWINDWDFITDTTSTDNTTWIDMEGIASTYGTFSIIAGCGGCYHGYDIATLVISTVIKTEMVKILADDGAISDRFGKSVYIDGDYAIVGAPANDDDGYNSGSAYIYLRSGSNWNEQVKLTASDGAAYDEFGRAVAINDDTAIVGAISDDYGNVSGAAYIYVRSGTSWSEETKLHASDAAEFDYFGCSVAIDGDYAIVGAHQNDDNGTSSGAAYVFLRTGTSWSEQTKLLASDATEFDFFGWGVSINDPYAIVGGVGNDDNGDDSGSAYVFVRSGTSWSEQTKLLASDGATDDDFGGSVFINDPYVIVGAIADDVGASDSGSAYVFVRSGTSWSEQAKLTASDATADAYFGRSLSLEDNLAVIGAPGITFSGTGGTGYVFERSGSDWTEVLRLKATDDDNGDNLGYAVSASGDYAIVGAPSDSETATYAGGAYIFDLSDL